MRVRPSLLRIVLAALLLLQWGSAFAHCLRMAPAATAGDDLHLAICTPEGLRQVSLSELAADDGGADDRDAERGAGHEPSAVSGACPVCHSLGAALPPAGPTVSAPLVYVQATAAPPPPASPPQQARPRSCQPRAPPVS
jgi:hypothetical protein